MSRRRSGPIVSDEARRDVLALLRRFLGAGEAAADGFPSCTPQELARAAAGLRVLPHLNHVLKGIGERGSLYEGTRDQLLPMLRRQTAFAAWLHEHAKTAVRCLDAAGIPVVPFKGPFLSTDLYGDPLFRSARDVDLLLVRGKPDLAAACTALREIRYRAPDVPPAVMEYHRTEKGQLNLVGTRLPPLDIHYALYDDLPATALAGAAARAVKVQGEDPPRLRFAHVDLLMMLAVHYWRDPGPRPIHSLVDYAVLCRNTETFREGWSDIVRSWHMSFYVAATVQAVRRGLGVDPPRGTMDLLRRAVRPEARSVCERIARNGPESIPFGLVQKIHRLGLPWRGRFKAMRRSLWPHPGRVAAMDGTEREPPGYLRRLGYAVGRLFEAIRTR